MLHVLIEGHQGSAGCPFASVEAETMNRPAPPDDTSTAIPAEGESVVPPPDCFGARRRRTAHDEAALTSLGAFGPLVPSGYRDPDGPVSGLPRGAASDRPLPVCVYSVLVAEDDGLDAVAQAEFGQDVFDVGADR
jgi:hypothetical protein